MGFLKTFWVVPNAEVGSQGASSDKSGLCGVKDIGVLQQNQAQGLMKREREIDWVTEQLADHLRQVVAKNELLKMTSKRGTGTSSNVDLNRASGHIPLDDVINIIKFADYTIKASDVEERAKSVNIPNNIMALLRQYISIVSFVHGI